MGRWHGKKTDLGSTVSYKAWYRTWGEEWKFCNTDYACRWIKDYKDPICGWGYSGNGPKQLALAMLYHAISRRRFSDFEPNIKAAKIALKYHEQFARQYVSKFGHYWRVTRREIVFWLLEQRIKDFFKRK